MTDLTDLKAKAATGAFEPGRDGNYGYAHDPADERRDAARRDDARIAVCRAVPALIAEREADAAWMAEARRLLIALERLPDAANRQRAAAFLAKSPPDKEA